MYLVSFQQWVKGELSDYLKSDNDVLDLRQYNCDAFIEFVRDIQDEVINYLEEERSGDKFDMTIVKSIAECIYSSMEPGYILDMVRRWNHQKNEEFYTFDDGSVMSIDDSDNYEVIQYEQ